MRVMWAERTRQGNLLGYGAAVISVALALIIHLLLGPNGQSAPFALFFAAVAFSTWYGGLGAGLVATVLSALAGLFFLLPPIVSLSENAEGTLVPLALFVIAALLINGLGYARTVAENSIRGERAQLQVTLASIGDAVITTDTQGRVTFMNGIAESLTGWPGAEARGKELREVFNIVDEANRAPAENPVARVLAEGVISGLANHTIIIGRDGTERPIDDSAAPIRDAKGAITGVVLVFRDITERKLAEDELQKSRDQLEIILRGVADGITAQDAAGRLIYANDKALRTLGFRSVDELRAAAPGAELQQFQILDEEGFPLPLDRLPARLALQGKESPDTLVRWRIAATGEEHWSIVKATPALDDSGRPYMAISIFRDITEQRLAEQERERLLGEVQSIAERLDNIVANVPGVVWEAWGNPGESDQRIDYVSKYAEHMLGYTTEEWLATPNFWLTIVHPDDKEEAARVVAEQYTSGTGGINRFRWVTKDGRILWAEANATVVMDAKGTPVGMRGVTMDLSDRKRLEDQAAQQADAIKTEYERLAALVANVNIGLSMTDAEGRIIIANEKWLQQTGYGAEHVIGHRHEEFSSSPESAQTQAVIDRVLSTGQPFEAHEYLVQSGDRLQTWYADASVLPLRDAGGAVTGTLSVSVDVTDNVRAHRQIEAQRAILETIVEGAPIGVAMLDSDMRIINLNAEWARMTGVDLASARGRVLYDAAPSFEERRPAYERVLKGQPVHLTNVPYQAPGKDKTHFRDIYMRPVRDAAGAITGMLNAVIDVTERHTLDQQKDALIALASHELKTPITAIKGYTQLSLRAAGASGDERLVRALRIVDDKTNLLTRLVNEMLDVSRIQSGTLPLQKESFDLGLLVKEVASSIELTEPDFTFTLDIPSAPMEVTADRQRIEQVITNLLQNAVKYSGDSRRVEIAVKPLGRGQGSGVRGQASGGSDGGSDAEASPPAPEVLVSVRDQGMGIPEDQQPQLFERFFRATNAMATQSSGLGLGLYISHDIVARHEGRMWCESQEGHGSTFYFTLPLLVG